MDNYSDFLHTLQSNFSATLATGQGVLFETDADGLFDAYLANLPPDQRQHHNCSCCRAFVKRFGGLVTIDSEGRTRPALWDDLTRVSFGIHDMGIGAMHRIVSRAKVKAPFLHADTTWGTPEAGGFSHMHVSIPATARCRFTGFSDLTARQRMAMRREQFGTLSRALAEIKLEHVRTALQVLQANALYRSERFLGPMQFLENLMVSRGAVADSKRRDNLTWLAVATAPDGFCSPRSTVIGSLLEDVAAGYPFDAIKRRFESKVDATVYQRSQAAPSAGAIQRAETLFAELGLAPALARRYAEVSEVPLVWDATLARVHARQEHAPKVPAAPSVFGAVVPKGAPASVTLPELDVPTQRMTWAKFRDTVLPTAVRVEAQVPASADRFAALVNAADPTAPNLLAWDNPFSWYYAAGIDGEFRKRVTEAGGQYENVDIRATLLWNNRNDLDLHVITPAREHIYYGAKRDRTGGWLDVDMNISGETTKPVENVRWPKGSARAGRYEVRIWNYRHHERGVDTPYRVELEIGGQSFQFEGNVSAWANVQLYYVVAQFDVDHRGQLVPGSLVRGNAVTARNAAPEPGQKHWGLTPGAFVRVAGIAQSPNMWGKEPRSSYGEHTFFLLDGCHDDQAGRGRGFMTEMMRGDLREVRSVVEAYNSQAVIAPVENPACGLGMVSGREWNLLLRVQTPTIQQHYFIDRAD